MSAWSTAFRLRALAFACASLSLWTACGEEAAAPELPPRAIRWMRVTDALASEQRVISGIVTAVDETSLAFEVGGTVETVDVDLGDLVEKGQELARLDPEPFELAVRDAEAALTEARALQAEARTTYDRFLEASKTGAVAKQDLDQALARRDSRDSQVEAAQARLKLERRDQRRSVLRAPFRGSISVRSIDPAMKVMSGEVAFEMDSAESGLQVEVMMPETLIARVRQGDEAVVRFPSLSLQGPRRAETDRPYRAVVSEVGTRASVGNAFPVKADLTESPAGIKPGMTAEVSFSVEILGANSVVIEGYLIPLAAVNAEADDRFTAFVYDPETSTVRKTPIVTGGVRENEIAVLEGISAGDVIATAGVSFLRDGQEVTLLGKELMRGAP